MDNITPPCATEEGCWIPQLKPAAGRALELHRQLRSLKDMGMASYVCSLHGVTKTDVELLAAIEDFLRPDALGGEDGAS